jgi:hypothetical protein
VLTAIAVLIVSAVGGGVVGAFLTAQYPANSICGSCQDRAVSQQYQMESYYQSELDSFIREQNKPEDEEEIQQPRFEGDYPEEDYYQEPLPENGMGENEYYEEDQEYREELPPREENY